MINKKRGFTLIELLVVVLIIGILAAIALPKYQVAVFKSKFTPIMSVVQSIASAEERYFLATGKYTGDMSLLDVSLPENFTCTVVTSNGTGQYGQCKDGKNGINIHEYTIYASTSVYAMVSGTLYLNQYNTNLVYNQYVTTSEDARTGITEGLGGLRTLHINAGGDDFTFLQKVVENLGATPSGLDPLTYVL